MAATTRSGRMLPRGLLVDGVLRRAGDCSPRARRPCTTSARGSSANLATETLDPGRARRDRLLHAADHDDAVTEDNEYVTPSGIGMAVNAKTYDPLVARLPGLRPRALPRGVRGHRRAVADDERRDRPSRPTRPPLYTRAVEQADDVGEKIAMPWDTQLDPDDEHAPAAGADPPRAGRHHARRVHRDDGRGHRGERPSSELTTAGVGVRRGQTVRPPRSRARRRPMRTTSMLPRRSTTSVLVFLVPPLCSTASRCCSRSCSRWSSACSSGTASPTCGSSGSTTTSRCSSRDDVFWTAFGQRARLPRDLPRAPARRRARAWRAC